MRKTKPFAERFWSKVQKTDACWIWTACIGNHGYGVIGKGRFGHFLAHREAYELARGPIPEGLYVDHLCRVRHCVNPSHMELVTNKANILRGTSPSAINAIKTHCIHGHSLDSAIIEKRGRRCRICTQARDRERARKQSESRKVYMKAYHQRRKAALQ